MSVADHTVDVSQTGGVVVLLQPWGAAGTSGHGAPGPHLHPVAVPRRAQTVVLALAIKRWFRRVADDGDGDVVAPVPPQSVTPDHADDGPTRVVVHDRDCHVLVGVAVIDPRGRRGQLACGPRAERSTAVAVPG